MKPVFVLGNGRLIASLVAASVALSTNAPAAESRKKADGAEAETATRVQVFLDRAQFAPGKIDGKYGEFTLRALALYRQANGTAAAPSSTTTDAADAKKQSPPDVSDLDLASVDPLFIDYTVTEDDLASVGEVPESVPEQATRKALPYRSPAEAIAEKFHTDIDYFAELNPGKTNALKAGDIVRVPNVEPFQLTAVKELKPGGELGTAAANEFAEEPEAETKESKNAKGSTKSKETPAKQPPPTASVRIDTATNMLSVYDGEKLIAAFPVTIGSDRTKSPVGDWKIAGVAKMPNFRYDESMLKKGERSDDFHLLPPGPNNPVGVVWIALNKKGIGLHGTNEPDTIGRSVSHGCIRLANWDVVRLAGKITKGVPVTIQ